MPADAVPNAAHSDRPGPPASSAGSTEYVYGVAHMQDGHLQDHQRHLDRASAEHDLAGCRSADLNECYLVRMPVGGWERVPNGC